MEEFLSFTLLHDTIPTDVGTESESLIEVWAVYGECGTQSAEWAPYYEAGRLVNGTPRGVELSFYRRPDDALLVVANPTYEPASGRVTLDLPALVGSAEATALNMRTGESVALTDGGFAIDLPGRRMTLVRVWR